MKSYTTLCDGRMLGIASLIAYALLCATHVIAQNPGSPEVANVQVTSSGVQVNQAYPNSYIDASASSFATAKGDFCTTLYNALAQVQLPGYSATYLGTAVVDARGITASFTCSTSSALNPFSALTSVAATVLLPQGQIQICTPWVIPSGVKLIGVGGEDPALGGFVSRTWIQASTNTNCTGAFSGSGVIVMGTGSNCTGTSIEQLVVDAQGQAIDGIDNEDCGDQSYVKNVTLYQVLGVGLDAYKANVDDNTSPSPTDSGPYTNITFDTNTTSTTTSTYGFYITKAIRGIQGITCTTGSPSANTTNSPGMCIYLDHAGNSVADVRIEGFTTGIEVLSSNEVLINIDGDTSFQSSQDPTKKPPPVIVVEIASGQSNVAVLGVTNNCGASCGSSNYTIDDLASGNTLTASTDPSVAMYVLGNEVTLSSTPSKITGYSLYSTSSSIANWQVGGNSSPGTCTTRGSLYSYTYLSTASPVENQYSLFVCNASGSWVGVE
jgi:hypothetical protein